MENTKYSYFLVINEKIKTAKKYTFDYGKSKNITIRLRKNKAEISTMLTKNYENVFSGSYLENLLKEGVKRVALLHLLSFDSAIEVDNVKLSAYRNDVIIFEKDCSDSFRLFSMIQGSVLAPVSKQYRRDDILTNIISKKKSEFGSETSSLYAYLYSKCQGYEIEKFMYLWMAFNGFYQSKYANKNDKDSIGNVLKEYNLGKECFAKSERDAVGKKVMVFLAQLSNDQLGQLKDEQSETAMKLKNMLQKKDGSLLDISATGFVTIDFAYFLRCTIFHANKPMLLFAFENDMELRTVCIVNHFLEEFLDKHLIELFK